jgi:hypothetical protein
LKPRIYGRDRHGKPLEYAAKISARLEKSK